MPTLRLSYTAYVDVKVPSAIAGMMKSGLVGYGNKWGDVFLRGLEKKEYVLVGHQCDVDYKRADDEEWLSDNDDEVWNGCEKCCGCDKWLGDTIFTDEIEFNAHPDREGGYDEDNNWWCLECRKDNVKADEDAVEATRSDPPPVVVEPLPVPPRKSVRLSGQTGSVKPMTFPFPQLPSKGFTLNKDGLCDCCEPPKSYHKVCGICKGNAGLYGNNPYPLPFETVCDDCNMNNVLPARMGVNMFSDRTKHFSVDNATHAEKKKWCEEQQQKVIEKYSVPKPYT
jgi:hypothetical protein